MCTKDFVYQEFRVEGDEFREYAKLWWKRVTQYYAERGEKNKQRKILSMEKITK